jgi:hypothetical protein
MTWEAYATIAPEKTQKEQGHTILHGSPVGLILRTLQMGGQSRTDRWEVGIKIWNFGDGEYILH